MALDSLTPAAWMALYLPLELGTHSIHPLELGWNSLHPWSLDGTLIYPWNLDCTKFTPWSLKRTPFIPGAWIALNSIPIFDSYLKLYRGQEIYSMIQSTTSFVRMK